MIESDHRRSYVALKSGLAFLPNFLVVLYFSSLSTYKATPQLDLPRATLNAGMDQFEVQLATTPAQQESGLMFRENMPHNEGMLFEFAAPGTQCFWMKNTILPLTAAFIADDGTIVNIADMVPQTTVSHCSAKPVRFVLEMNQGWFSKRGIKAGFRLGGKQFVAH